MIFLKESILSKYRSKGQREHDGYFASKKELKRYRQLQLLEKAGKISQLKRQVAYELFVGEDRFRYIADHVYTENGIEVVEDVKSKPTAKLEAYRIKKALMFDKFGIRIYEYGVGEKKPKRKAPAKRKPIDADLQGVRGRNRRGFF